MAAIPITIGQTARLTLVLADGHVGRFPQAKIYLPGNPVPTAIINLAHTDQGMYEGSYLPPAINSYQVVYTVFNDPAHLIVNPVYSKELDQLLVQADTADQILVIVQDIKTMVQELLDLQEVHEFIDNTVYDDCCQVLSSRIRIFDTKVHCELATDGGSETLGLLATYQIIVDYEGPARMKTYRKVRL